MFDLNYLNAFLCKSYSYCYIEGIHEMSLHTQF